MSAIRVLSLTFIAALMLGNGAQAQECKFPAAIPIDTGEGAIELLSRALDELCPTPMLYKPWADVLVTDIEGAEIGKTGDLLVGQSKEQPKLFLEVIGAQGQTFALEMADADFGKWYTTKQLAIGADDRIASYIAEGTLLSNGSQVPVTVWNTLASGEMAAAMLLASANPYPELMIVRFESEPADALVTVGTTTIGSTETRAWVARESLVEISVHMDGYRTCRYVDGEFREPTVTGDARFYCQLKK